VGQTYATQFAEDRETYYESGYVIPFVIFDGSNVVWEQSPSSYESRYRDAFDIALTVTPLFNITVTNPTTSATQASFDLELVPTDTLPEDEIHAFVMICEDSLPGSYTTFMYAARDMQEVTVDVAYPDTFTQTITFSHNIPPHTLSAAVFVQDIDTKEVMQSIMTRFEEE
jgi:hypothetical protein